MTDADILKDSGVDFLAVVVDRQDVERLHVETTPNVLQRLLQDRQTVVSFRARLDIAFAGYDDDTRCDVEMSGLCFIGTWERNRAAQQQPCRANPVREEVRRLQTQGESLAEISEWYTKTTREEAGGA